MSVVRINAMQVPEAAQEGFEARFAARAGMVEGAEGFEHFELLRPADGSDRYLVYTRWRSVEDFERWQESQAFRVGHAAGGIDAAARDRTGGGTRRDLGVRGAPERGAQLTCAECWRSPAEDGRAVSRVQIGHRQQLRRFAQRQHDMAPRDLIGRFRQEVAGRVTAEFQALTGS